MDHPCSWVVRVSFTAGGLHDSEQAARLLDVPVEVFASTDDLAIVRALIGSNRNRHKENEQKAREATRLLEVEQEEARRRQQAAGEQFGRGMAEKLPVHV